jgi:hypothetical protein
MTAKEPDGPYVYQPYGALIHRTEASIGRLYGVSGVSPVCEIRGLTKEEAVAVCHVIRRIRERVFREARDHDGD